MSSDYLNQVGQPWDLNPGPPECESRALPWSHLAWSSRIYSVLSNYISHLFFNKDYNNEHYKTGRNKNNSINQ